MAIINGRGRVGIRPTSGSGTPSYDSDAQAFFTANSTLTDVAQKDAINQFVLDLKSNSLWSLRGNGFLTLGFLGNSTKVSIDLFKPSNVFTFSSGWNFNSNGIKGNGSSTLIRTNFIPSSHAVQNSKTYFVYSQENVDQLGADLGALGTGGDLRDVLIPRFGNTFYGPLSMNGWQTASNSNSSGLILATRNGSTDTKFYRGSTLLGSSSSASVGQTPHEVYLGCHNVVGTGTWFSSKRISIYGQMLGLDATQVANLNTCINTLLTTLSIPTW
jgi:hypothetical protein